MGCVLFVFCYLYNAVVMLVLLHWFYETVFLHAGGLELHGLKNLYSRWRSQRFFILNNYGCS